MFVAVQHLQSVYYIDNARFIGHACKTNRPSCIAMRGFGRPQSLLMMEAIMSHVADTLDMEKDMIQEMNFLSNGQKFVNGLTVENCTIKQCWTSLLEKCNYYKRKEEVKTFNK